MSIRFSLVLLLCCGLSMAQAQQLPLPNGDVNYRCRIGRHLGTTDIDIRWNAPGVKGRDGKIWGSPVAHYGFEVLGFGSDGPSPWRAGADESTTIEFSTDVLVQGKPLAAGKYGFFIALAADSCTLIFSRNTDGWGSYFYRPEWDVLRVPARQQKDMPFQERLEYQFLDQTANSVTIALDWERWRIPFVVQVDLHANTVAALRRHLSGGEGFDPPSLRGAARWCLDNDTNLEEALVWVNRATDPTLGGDNSFGTMSVKSGLLRKMGRSAEADKAMELGLQNASVIDLHGYGRQLIAQKKPEQALAIFQKNHQKNGDTWPVNVGLARGYSATGNLKKALEHAKMALKQAPDDTNKASVEAMIKVLSEGKPVSQ